MDPNSDGGSSSDFLALLQQLESGGRNIPNATQGTSSGQAQGFEQITTGTWNQFAPSSGVDLHRYPTPISAPPEVQLQVAKNIPMHRWDPKTLRGLISGGYTVDPNRTLGQNIALNGGAARVPERDILGEALGGIPAGRIDPSAPMGDSDPLAAATAALKNGVVANAAAGIAPKAPPPLPIPGRIDPSAMDDANDPLAAATRALQGGPSEDILGAVLASGSRAAGPRLFKRRPLRKPLWAALAAACSS